MLLYFSIAYGRKMFPYVTVDIVYTRIACGIVIYITRNNKII
jgi:hypothetical protein